MSLTHMAQVIYRANVAKGWWSSPAETIASKLLLIHSEVSEATEELRFARPCPKGGPDVDYDDLRALRHGGQLPKPEGFSVEIADVIIRCLDLCGRLDIDIEDVVRRKVIYNTTREPRHGGKAI